jgi:hypothetical protein
MQYHINITLIYKDVEYSLTKIDTIKFEAKPRIGVCEFYTTKNISIN